jgi:uncharacterized membrane protein
MKRKTLFFIILILIAMIPAVKALFIPEFYTSHDGETHTARLANYYLALKEGQFPPRLAPNLFGNLGFPIFIFIYPLPYFLGSIFYSVGFTFTQAFEIVIGLSLILSAITMFLFTKELFGRLPAFLAALFYSWAPYRFSQMYVRAAIAESFAYIFVPLILLSLYKVTDKKNRDAYRWIGLGSMSLAALLLSHQLVSLMFLPVIVIFGLVFLIHAKRRKSILKYYLLLGLLGIAISCFIYLPSLFERSYLHFDQLISYYSDHFVTAQQLVHSPWSYGFSMQGIINDDMSFQIGLTHLLAVFIAAIIIFFEFRKRRSKTLDKITFGSSLSSLILFAVSVSLMLEHPLIHWIWKNIPGVSIVDLPWRMLGVSVFAASILTAYIVFKTKNKLIFLILIFFVFYANRNHLRINETLVRDDKYFTDYLDTATWRNEFLPIWRKTNKWHHVEQNYRVSQGEVIINPIEVKTHKISLNLVAKENSRIDIHRLYFPGWKIRLDGRKLKLGEDYEISESIQIKTETSPYIDRSGFISVHISPGSHTLSASFTETPIRKVGFFVSILGFISSLILIIKYDSLSRK